MKALSVGAVLLLALALVAQAQYFSYHASTAGEGYARGYADVVRSRGQAALDASQATINLTEARQKDIQNQKEWTQTYFDMRKINRQARAAERAPRGTRDDWIRYAQAGRPKRLSPSELDTVSGKITWPVVLRDERFAKDRAQLEALFAGRASAGVIGTSDYLQITRTTDAMMAQLKRQIRDIPPADYTTSKEFLKSLAYEGRMPAG